MVSFLFCHLNYIDNASKSTMVFAKKLKIQTAKKQAQGLKGQETLLCIGKISLKKTLIVLSTLKAAFLMESLKLKKFF